MVIAVIAHAGEGDVVVQGDERGVPPGTPPVYSLNFRVSATDGPLRVGTALTVVVPAGTHKGAFNDIIVAAAKTWVDSQNGWTIDPKHVYFQPFVNGS